MSGEKGLLACAGICMWIFVLGLAVPTIYFGYADEDSSCQEGTRAGMVLSDWVKVTGIKQIVVFGTLNILFFLFLSFEKDVLMIIITVLVVADVLFSIAWWVIGVVILATKENNSCVSEGKGMAVMAIINLVLSLFSLQGNSKLVKRE
mgnify:CR=1 FL=1